MGRAVAAREVLKTMEEAFRGRYLPPYAKAIIHAGLGDRDAMFAALDKPMRRATFISFTCRRHALDLPNRSAVHRSPARCAFSRSSA